MSNACKLLKILSFFFFVVGILSAGMGATALFAGSAAGDSFYEPILEYPQYTKPVDYRGWKVPEILVSGHHANIARWRRKEALRRTLKCRPDLLAKLQMTAEDKKLMAEIAGEEEES